MISKTEAILLALPEELLQSILSYLAPEDLFNIDLSCKKLERLNHSVYHIIYDRGTYSHCISTEWKKLVLEELHLRRQLIPNFTPEKAIQDLHLEYYQCDDACLAHLSRLHIVGLRVCTEQRTTSWLEAMATALMAQGRIDEAKLTYERYLQIEPILPERTLLTVTRFGWPNTFPSLPHAIPQTIKEAAIFGAAIGCNQEMVVRLHTEGVSLNQRDGSQTLAIAAAAVGNLTLLEYLHQEDIDVLEDNNAPLLEATRAGHIEVVKFLLTLGGRPGFSPIGPTPIEIVIIKGHIQILRAFLRHAPEILSTKTTDGKPVVFSLTEASDPTTTFDFLVREERGALSMTDNTGNTLAHHAALHGNANILKQLMRYKIDILNENTLGHTPQELAGAVGHVTLAGWLADETKTAYQPQSARENAGKILASRHSLLAEILVSESRYMFPDTTDEKIIASIKAAWDAEGMEDKLVDIYLKWFSPSTLQLWNDLLGGELDQLVLRLYRTLWSCARSTTVKDEIEDSRLQLACLIVDKLVPFISIRPRFQEGLARNMASADLRALSEFFNGELGEKIAAGEMARTHDTSLVLSNFRVKLRSYLRASE